MTLCATLFYACGPTYVGAKSNPLMSGEKTAKHAGDSARLAQERGESGVLVDSSGAFAEQPPAQTPKETKVILSKKIDAEELFDSRCVACHGAKGVGAIAPPLSLKLTREELLSVIRDGKPSKGMPGWRTELSVEEINALVSYLFELKNTPEKSSSESSSP